MRKIKTNILTGKLKKFRDWWKIQSVIAEWLIACFFLNLSAMVFIGSANATYLQTGLEKSKFKRLTTSAEISQFLDDLSSRFRTAKKLVIGRSAQGRLMEALFLSEEMARFCDNPPFSPRLSVMIIGSQHGTEPSGAEAILFLARDILAGPLKSILNSMNLILVPNGNPDGRDNHRRVNGNSVNLSTNFTTLSEPETRAINDILIRWQPSAVLDVHESAIFKRKSLAVQGYMTDFEAQLEIANNPNVDRGIIEYSREKILPEIIARLEAQGLPARHYIGEITSIHQPIQHGGLSVRNLRNKAGMSGAFSFLLENRLDPPFGDFPTPRNIRVRVDKQYRCITAFLDSCLSHRKEIMIRSEAARRKWREPQSENLIHLFSGYTGDPEHPKISLTLLRLGIGEPTELSFDYHGRVTSRHPLKIPAAYLVTAHTDSMMKLFDFHHIEYEIIANPVEFTAGAEQIETFQKSPTRQKLAPAEHRSDRQSSSVFADNGSILIRMKQPSRRLIPLLLEPLSNSSIFLDPAYSSFIKPGEHFFIYRLGDLRPLTEDS
jgi:hypothetical protein